MILPELRLDLQVLLLAARANSSANAAQARRVSVTQIDAEPSVVDLRVRSIAEAPRQATGFFLVIFDEVVAAPAASAEPPDTPISDLAIISQLEEELERTRDGLHLTVEQYETSTEN